MANGGHSQSICDSVDDEIWLIEVRIKGVFLFFVFFFFPRGIDETEI